MKRIHPLAAIGSGVAIAGLVFGAAVAAPNLAQDVPASPTQQEALDGLETARRYIEQHPATTPTPTPTPTTPTPTVTPTTQPPVGRFPSGLPWSDGAFTMHSASNATGLANWRGVPLDGIEVFTSRANWGAQLNPWYLADGVIPAEMRSGTRLKTGLDLIVSVPLWTDDGNMGTDAQWRQLADQIEAKDPDAVIRLGWEFNCCFSRNTNSTTWKNQYNRAAAQMLAAAPDLEFAWNPNEGVSSNGVTIPPDQAYPGDLYVDSVWIDAYDWYSPYNSASNWGNHRDKQYGWNYWYNFARARGKTFGLGEGGLYTASSASGGDNPLYFRYIYDWLREKATAQPGSIRAVILFNETASYYQGALYPTTRNPNAGVEYRAQLAASRS